MKSPVLIGLTVLSLAANAALILKLQTPATPAADSERVSSVTSPASTDVESTNKTAANPEAPIPAAAQWAALPSDDLSALVARLRSEGFPASVVRAIVTQQVSARFADRRKALMPAPTEDTFWKYRTGGMFSDTDPARLAARRALNREQSQLLKELLGPDATAQSPDMEYYTKRQYGNLPPDKIEQVQQIVQDYSDLAAQARAEAQGITLPEDREKMSFLEKEKWKDLAAVLTPEELAEYELRGSPTASQMRYQLTGLEPTEQEFRTIFDIQKKYADQFVVMSGIVGGEVMNQRREAEKQMVEEVKAALGEERGAEYERSRDYNYQQLAGFAKRFDLPKQAAIDVWSVQKQAETLMRSRDGDAAARAQQINAFAEEANAKIVAAFGEKLAADYKEVSFWLRNLESMQRAAANVAKRANASPASPPAGTVRPAISNQ